MMWAIYLNGEWLGMIDTNEAWARPYWAGRCTETNRYVMQPVPAGRVPAKSLKHERAKSC